MRSIELKLFKFSELSKEAKERACEDWRNEGFEPFWTDENRKTMEAFAEVLPIEVSNWSYGGRGEGVTFSFRTEHDIESLSGQRLANYIWNNYGSDLFKGKYFGHIKNSAERYVHPRIRSKKNGRTGEYLNAYYSRITLETDCVLTGYYMDNIILGPIYDFLNKPDSRTFNDLLDDCFCAWVKGCNEDVESQQTDEYIGDHLEANEYEFTEDGERY